MSLYKYTKTPVAGARLGLAIVAAMPSPVCLSIVDTEAPTDNVEVLFADDLTAEEQTTVGDVIAAHVAYERDSITVMPATVIAQPEVELRSSEWVDVGGLVAVLGCVALDAACSRFRVLGDYKSDGTIELRVVTGDGTVLNESAISLADSSGAWETFSGDTDTAPAKLTLDRYTLQARRVSGTSAALRFVSLSSLLKTN